ncbi:hypothetical protein DPEC_G00336860 [Dallia pectoralis]|uniref:Uncharacterized protein n=1 Tax=Dallia pectoralis TaxID=75939 RepID=A0ACC2F7J6_DALPE|nr:hypothetical protein DPEC_G00336860 [Dallia pectoralis]
MPRLDDGGPFLMTGSSSRGTSLNQRLICTRLPTASELSPWLKVSLLISDTHPARQSYNHGPDRGRQRGIS